MDTAFETILLKKLLYNSEFFGKVVPLLQARQFVNVGNQNLFSLIKHHYDTYKFIPTLTEVVAVVKNVPNDETRAAIIAELQAINTTENVDNMEFMLNETVEFIKDAMYMEALILGSDGLTQKSPEKKLKAKQIMEEMSKISIDTDLGIDFDNIELMIEYYQNKLIGVLTQHTEFNKRIGTGFLPKTLSVIMAASGIGKSLMMTDFISGHIKDKKNVLLVSMEMEDKEIMKRVHANALDLPINELTKLDPQVIRNAHEKVKSGGIGQFRVKDYPNGQFSAMMLEHLVESYKIEQNLEFDIIYLDYVGIMKSDLMPPSVGLYSYVKSIVEEVRAVAKKLGIAIVSASQLNRSAVNNTDASNDSVSDSIGTVQTADFIVFLLQNEQMKEENLITCKCTKNRFTGRTDTWDMNVDYEHMRFTDVLVQGNGLTTSEANDAIETTYRQDIAIMKENDMTADDEDDVLKILGL